MPKTQTRRFDITSETEMLGLKELAAKEKKVWDSRYSIDANPQLSISDLMWITVSLAVSIAAITNVGIVGTLVLFGTCWLVWFLLPRRIDDPTRLRFWDQYLWGILMPIACVFGDPFVFGSFQLGKVGFLHSYSFATYSFIGIQMLTLVCSWFVSPSNAQGNQLIGGVFSAGAIFSYVVAFVISPFAIVGSFLLVGLPGFTPWFTGRVFFRSADLHLKRGGKVEDNYASPMVLIGLCFPIAVATIAWILTKDIAQTNSGHFLMW